MFGLARRRVGTLMPAFLFSIATVSLALPPPATPAAAAIKCGTVINANTTLTANVGPCAKGGLVVGSDSIVLDLGGFAVFGKANRPGDGTGIRLTGRTGVTVRNGRVSDFDTGVAIQGGGSHTITDLLVRDNIASAKSGGGNGIAISESDNNGVLSSEIVHNGPLSGASISGASDFNLIESNVVTENNVPSTGDVGIRIDAPGSTGNVVRGNTVSASSLDGIVLSGQLTTGSIEANTVTANGFGFLASRPGDGIRADVGTSATVIQNNSLQANAGNGILIAQGSLNNEILTNTSTGNARQAAPGTAFDLNDANENCDNNVWFGNVFATANRACTAS